MPKPIEMFNLLRFNTPLDASGAVASLQAFLVTPSARAAIRPVVLRLDPSHGDAVLYLSDGALSAANQARILLPPTSERVPRGTVPSNHSRVRMPKPYMPGAFAARAP